MSFDYIYCHFLTRSLLRKVEILFLLNNLSLLWPNNVKHGVLVSYIKRQLEIGFDLLTQNKYVVSLWAF